MIVEHLEQLYRNQARDDTEKPRRWNRASSMGRCPRELAYTKLGTKPEPLTPRRMSIFDDGHFYDEKLKNDIVKAYPWAVPLPLGSWPSVWIEGVEITGTPDFLIMPSDTYSTVGLGEIKSMSNFGFDRAVAGQIDEAYCCQAWTYASQNALNPVVFICVRKETRHICEVIFDKTAPETIVTKRYGGNELEIAANDPMLIAEVRSPFDTNIERRVRDVLRNVAGCNQLSELPAGVLVVEDETVSAHGKEKAAPLREHYGEPSEVTKNGWYSFKTGRQVLGFPCSYCGFLKQCFPTANLEIDGGKPKWIMP